MCRAAFVCSEPGHAPRFEVARADLRRIQAEFCLTRFSDVLAVTCLSVCNASLTSSTLPPDTSLMTSARNAVGKSCRLFIVPAASIDVRRRPEQFQTFFRQSPQKSPTCAKTAANFTPLANLSRHRLCASRALRHESREAVTFSCGHRRRGPSEWRAAERRGEP
jgi:hypothetical protein